MGHGSQGVWVLMPLFIGSYDFLEAISNGNQVPGPHLGHLKFTFLNGV